MTCPTPTPNFGEIISSLSVTYSVAGSYSASAEIADTTYSVVGGGDQTCGFNNLGYNSVYRVTIDVDSFYCDSDSFSNELKALLTGSILAIEGQINSISDSRTDGSRGITLNFESKFHWLTNKSINTEPFFAVSADTAIESILAIYCGLSSTYYSISSGAELTYGPAFGNNAMEELRALAQAGRSVLFVQTDGKLTTLPWWDCSQQGNYLIEIPCTLVENAERTINVEPPPTVIRVRGANLPYLSGGFAVFSDSMISDTDTSGYDSTGAGSHKCVRLGIAQKEAELVNNNLSGTNDDLKNAEVSLTGLTLRDIADINSGKMTIKVTSSDQFMAKGDHTTWTSISGKRKIDRDSPVKLKPMSDDATKPMKVLGNLRDAIVDRAASYAGQGFGSGISGGAGHNSPYFTNSESSYSQSEVVVYCPAWIAAWGVREESIDNKFVGCPETLADIGIMRFQQWMMEQNTWTVDMVPMPGLKLWDYIKINLPETLECTETYIEGLVGGITYSWDAATSNTTMKVTLLGTDNLCSTSFYTGNLIRYDVGQNGDSNFSGSGASLNAAGVFDGLQGLLVTVDSGFAWIWLDQACMNIGDSYNLSFIAEFVDGGVPSMILTSDTTVSDTIIASNTYSYNFTATATEHQFRWSLVDLANSQLWRIRNLRLTKVVTA